LKLFQGETTLCCQGEGSSFVARAKGTLCGKEREGGERKKITPASPSQKSRIGHCPEEYEY